MSFQKVKSNSFFVGQKQYSGTKNIVVEINFKRKLKN